jgi:hypothetical protein
LKTIIITAAAILATASTAMAGNGAFFGNSDDWYIDEAWSDYTVAPTVCEYDTFIFGTWQAGFDGGGCTAIVSGPALQLNSTATTAALVHSTLSQGNPTLGADIYLDVKLKTLQQLRTPTPNTYEVGWVAWNGRLDTGCNCYTFNYFIVKPTVGGVTGGYELGVVYNNGGVQSQRFLATGTGNYAINTSYNIEIWHANGNSPPNGPGDVVTVKVNGTTLVNGFVDSNHYMFRDGWPIGLYEESAKVNFISAYGTRL